MDLPTESNCGEIREAKISSVKQHLKRSLDSHHLPYDEHLTVLTKTEALLNSHLLCRLSNNPQDYIEYLSLGHFLFGTALPVIPDWTTCSLRRQNGSLSVAALLATEGLIIRQIQQLKSNLKRWY